MEHVYLNLSLAYQLWPWIDHFVSVFSWVHFSCLHRGLFKDQMKSCLHNAFPPFPYITNPSTQTPAGTLSCVQSGEQNYQQPINETISIKQSNSPLSLHSPAVWSQLSNETWWNGNSIYPTMSGLCVFWWHVENVHLKMVNVLAPRWAQILWSSELSSKWYRPQFLTKLGLTNMT